MSRPASRVCTFVGLCVLALVALPRPASAQWYLAGYFGASTTPAADIRLERPGTSLVFHDVTFASQSFAAPPYYGYRAGRLFGERRRIGVELEFIHEKVIAETNAAYRVSGTVNGLTIDTTLAMNTLVQRYAMTHGLNFILINVVSRTPLGDGRWTMVARGGAGPTRPHAETSIGGTVQEQYEYGGVAGHGAIGAEAQLFKWFSAFGEYKLTFAKPEISVPAGTGRMTALSHHVAFGLAFGGAR